AKITRYRQYTAGLLSVQNEGQLPDPRSVPAGTLAVPSASGRGIFVRSNTRFEWVDPVAPSPWEDVFQANRNGWRVGVYAEKPMARRTATGSQLTGFFFRNDATSSTFGRITESRFFPNRRIRAPMATSGSPVAVLIIDTNGDLTISGGYSGTYVSVDG